MSLELRLGSWLLEVHVLHRKAFVSTPVFRFGPLTVRRWERKELKTR